MGNDTTKEECDAAHNKIREYNFDDEKGDYSQFIQILRNDQTEEARLALRWMWKCGQEGLDDLFGRGRYYKPPHQDENKFIDETSLAVNQAENKEPEVKESEDNEPKNNENTNS